MAIVATNEGGPRELIPAGNYVARCYQMVHLGEIPEEFKGVPKFMNKVRITFELPNELKEFKEGEGLKPYSISAEFTVSLADKSNLRKFLEGWRSRGFSEDELKAFDVSKLLGVPCLLNVIHKVSKSGKAYEFISSASPIPRGMTTPAQINPSKIWEYDNPDWDFFHDLPDFVKTKIMSSRQYAALDHEGGDPEPGDNSDQGQEDDLPF